MIKQLGKKLLHNKIFNYLGRNLLNKGAIYSAKFFNYMTVRWKTSGINDCKFNNIKFKLFNNCDDSIVSFFYYDNFKFHEKSELQLFLQLAKGVSCIVDVGANTGYYSILSSLVNPKAHIFAFEPYSVNAERLKINLELNAIKNVNVFTEAIGEAIGNIELSIPKNKTITDVSSVNKDFGKKIYPNIEWVCQKVNIRTLNSFASEYNLQIDLIKCDVETFEKSVFNGATDILKTHRPTILFETFLNEDKKAFFNDILEKYNYYVYLITEDGIVYNREGMQDAGTGNNYLLTPIKPNRTFINYKDLLIQELLIRPIIE